MHQDVKQTRLPNLVFFYFLRPPNRCVTALVKTDSHLVQPKNVVFHLSLCRVAATGPWQPRPCAPSRQYSNSVSCATSCPDLFLSLSREISWVCCKICFSSRWVEREYSSNWISNLLVWFSTWCERGKQPKGQTDMKGLSHTQNGISITVLILCFCPVVHRACVCEHFLTIK